MGEASKISVAMATYNEEKALPCVVAEIRRYADDCEIVIVDSSTDGTAAIARNLGVIVIGQEKRGHGAALREAIKNATGDVIITADCDSTYPMDRIPDLVKLVVDDGYDVVSCCRLTEQLKGQMPFSNMVANKAFAAIVRFLYKIDTHDVTTGMFAMKRKVAHEIGWETNYSFPAEIIIRSNLMGFRYREIPISYRVRIGEVTLNKWKSGKAYLKCFLKYKYFPKIDLKSL